MILEPSKAFIAYLTRYIQDNFSVEVEKLIYNYLESHSVNNNPAVSEWYARHFTEAT